MTIDEKMRRDETNWIRRFGGIYYFKREGDKLTVMRRTPNGDVVLMENKTADGKPNKYLTEFTKEQINARVAKLRSSKFLKRGGDEYKLTGDWHKNIKARKAVEERWIKEGDRLVKATFEQGTGERIK